MEEGTVAIPHKRDLTTPTLNLTPLQKNVDSPLSTMPPSPFSTIPISKQIETGRSPNKHNFHPTISYWICLTPTFCQSLQAHPAYWPILTSDHFPHSSHHVCLAHSLQPHRENILPLISANYPTQISHNHLALSAVVCPTPQQTHELREPLSFGTHLSSHQITKLNPTVQEQSMRTQYTETTDVLLPQLSPILRNRTHRAESKKKGKQMATRRNPCLQAKQSASHSMVRHSNRAKSLTAKLPFDHAATNAPNDADTTLTILQASGLEITKQVHKMIEEAVRQDKQEMQEEETTPTTPLHDHIPPLAVP